MVRYDKLSQALAVGLAAVAGYVDALGYLHFGGYFASFMSGNSTRLAIGLVSDRHVAAVAGGLIGLFVLGVMLGALVGQVGGRHRAVVVLACATMLLFAAAGLAQAGSPLAAIPMVLAMGAENAVFQRNGDVSIGLTYMTGTLVKFGQRLTAALMGGDRFGWLPYGLLWSGLVSGALVGAALYPRLHLEGLWVAAIAMTALLLWAAAMPRQLRRAMEHEGA